MQDKHETAKNKDSLFFYVKHKDYMGLKDLKQKNLMNGDPIMKRILVYIFLVFLLFIILDNCSKKEKNLNQIQFEELPGNLFLIIGGGANVVASFGRDGLLLIDTKLPSFTERIISEFGGNDPIPKLLVIDTHYHPDHIIGNKSWRGRGALIAAHQNTLKRMQTGQYSSFWNERIPPAETGALPSLTFQESITLHFNDDEVTISHLAGHTDGDISVYFQKANVIHLGDIVFNGIFPNSDLDDGGSINLQILAVQHILTFIDDETTIIVGHGPPMNRMDLEKCHAMLVNIREQIDRQIQMGRTLDQIIASQPTSMYEDSWEYGSLTRDRYIELLYQQILAVEKR